MYLSLSGLWTYTTSWDMTPLRPEYVQLAFEHWEESNRSGSREFELLSLVTALEALFNVGAHDIRYRIARSIAVLLGKDAEDSDYLFEAVSKAYEVRSKLVHTGKAKGIDSVWLWQLQRAVQRAIVRCLTLAQPKESLSRQLTRLGFGQGRALVTSPLLQTSALDSLGSRKSKSRDVA